MDRIEVEGESLLLRPMRPEDKKFVFANWLHSNKQSCRNWHVKAKEYYFYEHAKIEHLMENASVGVLCYPDVPDVLFGFACYESLERYPIIHYLYLKSRLRGHGFGWKLLHRLCQGDPMQTPIVYTNTGKRVHELRKRAQDDGANWTYNPYILDALMAEALKGMTA